MEPTDQTKLGLSGELAELRSAISGLKGQLDALENKTVPDYDARFRGLDVALRDFDTRFDALENRVILLETGVGIHAIGTNPVTGEVSDIGVDPAWLKYIFEKYFWNERPIAPTVDVTG